MKHRLMMHFRAMVGLAVSVSLLLASCEVDFEANVVPFVTEPPPGIALEGETTAPNRPPELDAGSSGDLAAIGVLDSSDALALCGELELVGNSQAGSCLAPGGGAYYVWIDPDSVLLISRDDEILPAFREAVALRASSLADVDKTKDKWPELILFGGEILAVGLTCGGAVAAGTTGIGLVASALLASGCVGSLAAFGYTGVTITQEAQSLVESVEDVDRFASDAAYNYCRMEGKSDADCRD